MNRHHQTRNVSSSSIAAAIKSGLDGIGYNIVGGFCDTSVILDLHEITQINSRLVPVFEIGVPRADIGSKSGPILVTLITPFKDFIGRA